jgi:Mg2+-importing ATPase
LAAKVCHEVGLDAGDVVVGSDIEPLSDDALATLAQRTTLFARLTPMHKERIVTLLAPRRACGGLYGRRH